MRRKTSHKTVLEAVRKLVNALRGTCNILHQGHRGPLAGSAGIPDLYLQIPARYGVIPNGRRLWIEVKPEGAKVTPAQAAFKEREEALGGVVLVGGVDELIEYLGLDSERFLFEREEVIEDGDRIQRKGDGRRT